MQCHSLYIYFSLQEPRPKPKDGYDGEDEAEEEAGEEANDEAEDEIDDE